MERPDARRLIAQLNRDAQRIASHFRLRFHSIEAERANVKRRYGVCYSDGSIRIRLRHATTGKALKYSSLVNTLCHELAHLRHFNHGPRFRVFYLQLLEWARAQNIYRPAAQRPTSPSLPRTPAGWPPGSPRGIPDRRPAAAHPLRIQLDLFR
jgi:hypothetical protein